MAAMSAGDWRAFWQVRGMRELQLLLWAAWDPLDDGSPGEYDGYALRVASLLGSRASAEAIAAELGRIRRAHRPHRVTSPSTNNSPTLGGVAGHPRSRCERTGGKRTCP